MEGPLGMLMNRKAVQDMLIGDVAIQKGVGINYYYRANMFNPNYFDQPF